jgi:N-methylhydantoinase B
MTLTRVDASAVTDLGSKVSGLPVSKGDVLSLRTSGGGGYGDPGARDTNARQADLQDGYVSGGD